MCCHRKMIPLSFSSLMHFYAKLVSFHLNIFWRRSKAKSDRIVKKIAGVAARRAFNDVSFASIPASLHIPRYANLCVAAGKPLRLAFILRFRGRACHFPCNEQNQLIIILALSVVPGVYTCLNLHLMHDRRSICHVSGAGWSSLVARRAHNPKVVGSNPAPATTFP